MIDDVVVLRDQVLAEIGLHEEELARLNALLAALDAFIQQSELSGGTPAPTDPDKGRAGEETPAGDGSSRNGSTTAPAASSYTPVTCSGCGREFRSRQSLGPHKKGCPGRGAVPTTANGRVSFLCSRNCGATFETRAESDAHEKAASCAPRPTRPSTEEERRLRLAGSIGGLGE